MPGAFATGGVLTCIVTATTVQASPGGMLYLWTGPGGFSSTVQNPQVNMAGAYVVQVISTSNGCTNTAQALVFQNTIPPGASATGGVITCSSSGVMLQGDSSLPGSMFLWSGPGGFTSTFQNPIVWVRGTYTLTVTDAGNGCTSTAVASVQDICRLGPDFWKDIAVFPVLQLSLGTLSYDTTQLRTLLKTPVGSRGGADASLILAHQLIAVKLNIASGAPYPSSIQEVIASADDAIGNGALPIGVMPNSPLGHRMVVAAGILDSYNYVPLEPPPILLKGSNAGGERPPGHRLEQNYPNPFNPVTNFKFSLPAGQAGIVNSQLTILKVYDLLGREVATLVNEELPAGEYTRTWDARQIPTSRDGQASAFSETKRMILLR
jgi:hypothetical protein